MKFKQLVSTGLVIASMLSTVGCSSQGEVLPLSDMEAEISSELGQNIEFEITSGPSKDNKTYSIEAIYTEGAPIDTSTRESRNHYLMNEFHPVVHQVYDKYVGDKSVCLVVTAYDPNGNLITCDTEGGIGDYIDPQSCMFCNKDEWIKVTLQGIDSDMSESIENLLCSSDYEYKSYIQSDRIVMEITLTDEAYDSEYSSELCDSMANEGLGDLGSYAYGEIVDGINNPRDINLGLSFRVYTNSGKELYSIDY